MPDFKNMILGFLTMLQEETGSDLVDIDPEGRYAMRVEDGHLVVYEMTMDETGGLNPGEEQLVRIALTVTGGSDPFGPAVLKGGSA